MHLSLFNIDEFCKNLPEINVGKGFENGKFDEAGLFSQVIFGPIKSYHCGCLKNSYKGRNSKFVKCPVCGVDITTSEERKKRYAKIVLPFDVMNPIFFEFICNSKNAIRKMFTNLLSYKKSYYRDEDSLLKEYDIYSPPENVDFYYSGLNGVLKLIEEMIENEPDKEENIFLQDNFDKITIKNVIVIPPDFRPCGKNEDGIQVSDELNQLYSTLILRCDKMNSLLYQVSETSEEYKANFNHIQNCVFTIFDHILEKLSKKKGLIRSNILGKRVDFSGRAVISPDPTLKLNQCRLPYFMVLEILKPQLTAHLVNKGICKRYNVATDMLEECIQNNDFSLYEIVEEFVKNKVCVLNRQPTLHRLGVLGFQVTIHKGKTIQIHPLVCSPYNADFDGDCLAGTVRVRTEDKYINSNILELMNTNLFDHYKIKNKNGKTIQQYKPKQVVKIEAIDPTSGSVEWKQITDYFIHSNLKMFQIEDPQNRFETFWSSDDHSLIVYDEIKEEIVKITPEELKNNPEGKYLIKNGE